MDIFSVFTLCGGLAFFLYGMTVMSKSLEKMAGGKLERMLKRMTSSPFKSLLLGAGITIAIQSSSAMTVMLVGLVNSGVMEIGQTIGIIMGSESDMPAMEPCMKQLEEFGVPYEVKVASAHRKPAEVHEWASTAHERGIKVIIAAAGKAAHLGGVVAAYTPDPVIAVPMKTSDLGGLDSLLSMVQMPSGVPVATVAINGAKNAAILAVQIMGTGCDGARQKIIDMKKAMAEA